MSMSSVLILGSRILGMRLSYTPSYLRWYFRNINLPPLSKKSGAYRIKYKNCNPVHVGWSKQAEVSRNMLKSIFLLLLAKNKSAFARHIELATMKYNGC